MVVLVLLAAGTVVAHGHALSTDELGFVHFVVVVEISVAVDVECT